MKNTISSNSLNKNCKSSDFKVMCYCIVGGTYCLVSGAKLKE